MMESALEKIRPHTSSSLPHQKTPATLLHALESTLSETHTDRTPTAYFAALVTTLDGTLQKKDTALGDGDVLPAVLYLLALVAPFVPRSVIQSSLSTLLSLTAPLFPSLSGHAPPLRSQLTLYNAIFHSLDRSQLDTPAVRQSFATILQLSLDPRPKVRKRAIDLINDVLSNPPSPLLRHPYAERVAHWLQNSLQQASSGVLPKSKSAAKEFSVDHAIRLLTLLRPILPFLPLDVISPITSILLTLPRLGNPYLSQSSYSILSDLLSASVNAGTQSSIEQIPAVLSAVLSSPPPKSDLTVAPSWLRVLGDTMLAYRFADSHASSQEFTKVWKTVWSFFETSHAQTRKAVAEALESLCRCITLPMVHLAVKDTPDGKSPVRSAVAQITKALDSLTYASAIPELLHGVCSLTLSLGIPLENGGSTLAAEILVLPLVHKIAELRVQKNFEHKEAADSVLSTAMRVIGPAVVLEAIPLNLEPQDRQAGREPRAFLLPMLAQPHPSPLGHFVSYFVPLSERMFTLQNKAETEGKQSEAKVWHVLISQVWVGFAGYCHAPLDLKSALTPAFSQLLSQLLYTQPELRLSVLKGLKSLIESNFALQADFENSSETSHEDGLVTREGTTQNITFLKTQVESWLAVLFNVFGSVERESRGIVGDVISVWARIADHQEISKAYSKVIALFQQNLQKFIAAPDVQQNANVTTMTQDLLILLLPCLEEQELSSLVQICMSDEVLCCKNNGVQKRGYKILAKVLSSGKTQSDTLATLQQLDSFTTGLSPAAKRDRFLLLANLIPNIPSTSLHILPSLIPEAVLGTKEPSEKARSAAFELIVCMGYKMSEGGLVSRQMVEGMDEDNAPEASANINEYMTMVAGGLAGATPHMISATVTAISRLVFEFKDTIDSHMQTEILTTLLVFLSSSNREIVKSTLGYVKLAIHTLPTDLVRPHLSNLVPALLAWSHDHKNHFKAKVRHIFERMIRRFGWNDVYQAAGEEQASKVLVNIKKRKERAKRRKAHEDDSDDDDAAPSRKVATGDAFEDVLYGSESELDEIDEQPQSGVTSERKGRDHGLRLRVDDDEPLDLLQGAISQVTNAKARRRRKPGQDANRFKTDEESRKLVIPAEESDSDMELSDRKAGNDIGGEDVYKESFTSADGFARGLNGRIKFNKDTKKRRRDNADEDGDIEMGDAETATNSKKNKRRSEVKFGREFKAKKAEGDVKKGKLDPYAYLPLAQAAKRKGRDRIGIAGRR